VTKSCFWVEGEAFFVFLGPAVKLALVALLHTDLRSARALLSLFC